MNDITNGLREEIERIGKLHPKSYHQKVRRKAAKSEKWKNICRQEDEVSRKVGDAIFALLIEDVERMAAALEILRGIKE